MLPGQRQAHPITLLDWNKLRKIHTALTQICIKCFNFALHWNHTNGPVSPFSSSSALLIPWYVSLTFLFTGAKKAAMSFPRFMKTTGGRRMCVKKKNVLIQSAQGGHRGGQGHFYRGTGPCRPPCRTAPGSDKSCIQRTTFTLHLFI